MSLVNRLLARAKWLTRSSTLRLSLLLSLIFAIGMAVTVGVSLVLGQDAIERRVDETLVALAASASVDSAEELSPEFIRLAVDDLDGLPRPFERVIKRGGGTVVLGQNFLRSDVWRVLVARDADGAPIVVALPLEESSEAQELLAGVLWSTAALVIAVALAIGLIAGLLAQRRVQRINDTLGLLASGDLTARTGHSRSKDDLDDIARQLDVTATELERLVTQTRHLSASIAHDLRTPLARLRAQLEMLPEGEARGAALEEATRLSGIFDTIMRVARIEAGQGRDGFEDVDLAELIEELAEVFGPVVEDSEKALKQQVSSAKSVQADRQMLVQAMANLIQNALVHGGPEITLIAQGKCIGVADTGLGVDPDQYGEIIKPMVRLDAARSSEGSGLGLALVKAVAERHGARLKLHPNEPHGLKVLLDFADL